MDGLGTVDEQTTRTANRTRGRAPAHAGESPEADRVREIQEIRELREVRVWDGFVRVFHWSAVLLVVSLVLTAKLGWQDIHMTLGIDLLVLVVARLAWGVMDTGHARFANFVPGPYRALTYLRDIARGHPQRYLGHNPAGAMMVVALLSTLLGLLLTGLVLQATLEFEGPLVELLRGIDDSTVHRLLAVHRLLVDALYVLVPLHVAGVVLASVQHRENLVKAMITGRKSINHER